MHGHLPGASVRQHCDDWTSRWRRVGTAAEAFITRALALNTYFEGGPDKWNFRNEDSQFRNVVFSGARGSKVIAKLGKAKSHLPAAFYRGAMPKAGHRARLRRLSTARLAGVNRLFCSNFCP